MIQKDRHLCFSFLRGTCDIAALSQTQCLHRRHSTAIVINPAVYMVSSPVPVHNDTAPLAVESKAAGKRIMEVKPDDYQDNKFGVIF